VAAVEVHVQQERRLRARLFCTSATNFFACSGSTRESYSPATTSAPGMFTPAAFWYGGSGGSSEILRARSGRVGDQ
jgi:hypothetical protein